MRGAIRFGKRADFEPLRSWAARDASGGGEVVVSCGKALAGVEVAIVDDRGEVLPEVSVGEIRIGGTPVAHGYTEPDDESGARIHNGRGFTGDAGFMLNRDLYVIGRMTSSIKVHGRHIPCEGVETDIAEALGVPAGMCVVVPAGRLDATAVTVVLEYDAGSQLREVERIVRRWLGPSVQIAVAILAIPRTSSGTPRRRALWQLLHDGAGQRTMAE